MISPLPFPAELSDGVRGRFCCANQYQSWREGSESLRARFLSGHPRRYEVRSHDAIPSALLLAAACGLHPKFFLQLHTLMPYALAFTECGVGVNHMGRQERWMIHLFGFCDRSRAEPALCVDCVAEDNRYWGFSYWRREHQLPGIEFCSKHGCPLRRVKGKRVFDSSPEFWVASSAARKESDVVSLRSNRVLRRFEEISIAFLDREKPIDRHEAETKIRARLAVATISDTPSALPALERLAKDALPQYWLDQTLRQLGGEAKETEHDELLDESTWSRHGLRYRKKSFAFILALALVFDDTDDALRFITQDGESEGTNLRPDIEVPRQEIFVPV